MTSVEFVFGADPCPVCKAPYVVPITTVDRSISIDPVKIYYCMECESFFNESMSDERKESGPEAIEWHKSVEDRNRGYADRFLNAVRKRDKSIGSILEIGCGAGILLSRAADMGMKVAGFDTNQYVAAYGAERYNISIESDLWKASVTNKKYDLVVCISVMEHLHRPTELFAEIVDYCRTWGAKAYISLPFVDRCDWPWLIEGRTSEMLVGCFRKRHPWSIKNHVTHFSQQGFVKMAAQFGATTIEPFRYGWIGYWLEWD